MLVEEKKAKRDNMLVSSFTIAFFKSVFGSILILGCLALVGLFVEINKLSLISSLALTGLFIGGYFLGDFMLRLIYSWRADSF